MTSRENNSGLNIFKTVDQGDGAGAAVAAVRRSTMENLLHASDTQNEQYLEADSDRYFDHGTVVNEIRNRLVNLPCFLFDDNCCFLELHR